MIFRSYWIDKIFKIAKIILENGIDPFRGDLDRFGCPIVTESDIRLYEIFYDYFKYCGFKTRILNLRKLS